MYCAQMNGDSMILQNNINGDWNGGQVFHFAIDTCLNFQSYTGNVNCKTKAESYAVLD